MITIGNKRAGDTGVYVGRPTILGNPFEIGIDGNRDEVIDKYREWFYEYAVKRPRIRNFLQYLKGLEKMGKSVCLVCYCAPQRCHAEVIKEYLDNMKPEE